MWKTTAKVVAGVIVIAHIGVLGHLLRSQKSNVPVFSMPPVNEYSTFRVRATRDGYEIEYIGNDPRILTEETDVENERGVLGMGGRSRTRTTREFTQDGIRNRGGGEEELDGGKLSAEQIACIEAAGGGRSQGAIVGSSLAAGVVVPAVYSIPYVGWLAAGWATLLGTNLGGSAGAWVSSAVKGCL